MGIIVYRVYLLSIVQNTFILEQLQTHLVVQISGLMFHLVEIILLGNVT